MFVCSTVPVPEYTSLRRMNLDESCSVCVVGLLFCAPECRIVMTLQVLVRVGV